MNASIQIAAFLDKPDILEKLVEQLVTKQTDLGFGQQVVPQGQEALETASAAVYTSGAMYLQENNEQLNMPFITSFMFTCLKGNDGQYKLAWSTSLS